MSHEASDSNQLVFGIGCFSFEAPEADHLLIQKSSGSYSVHDWTADVERYLARMPSVDDIRVEGFQTVRADRAYTWRDTTLAAIESLEHDGMHHGGNLRPHPSRGRVSFTVTIPLRTQFEVMFFAEGRTGTRFDIDIRYGAGMPVAFVRSYEDFDDPSLAVAIVREFLRAEEASRSFDDIPIRFVAMGPSPLWSNFVVCEPSRTTAEDLDVETSDEAGYNWVMFRARRTARIVDQERAYALVKENLHAAASTYYEFISQRLVTDTTRRFIESELEELVNVHRANGFKAWLTRLWNGRRKANDLMLELLAVDLEQRRASESNADVWTSLEGSAGAKAFHVHVKRELRDESQDYVENARRVVEVLNARHTQDLEIVIVIVASVLGGAVGAGLTSVLGLLAGSGA